MKDLGQRAFRALVVALIGGSAAIVPGQTPPETWLPVTPERVLHPDDASWLGYRRTYDVTGFSPLKQINASNVAQLRPVWSYSVPDSSRWVVEPVVANGIMYITEAAGRVIALDAVTGDVIWMHERRYPKDVTASEAQNRTRGVVIYDDVVYWGTADSQLLALDARTGKVLWEESTGDYHTGEGHSHPPLVAEGKVFIGMAGGDRGARGRVTASDAKTGKLLWTLYTAPDASDPAYKTWNGRAKIPPMGAAPWNTISYDPELHLIYFGTGQPTPWSSAFRGGGDALYSVTMLAVDASTGKIRWHYQMVPGDNWDRAVYEGMLVDLDIKGKRRKALIATSKVGWGVVLDRRTGEFLQAFRTAFDNTITGFTPEGRAIMNPALTPKPEDIGSGKVFELCPHWHGARNLQAPSYSRETGFYYLGINNSCTDARVTPVDMHFALPGVIGAPGYDHRAMAGVSGAPKLVPGYTYVGEFVAFDPVTGKRAWAYRVPSGAAMSASALATAGGIVFGGAVDRSLFALDARNGALLWQMRLGGDVSGSPVAFEVGGRQYLAVAAGGKPGPTTSYAPLTGTELSRGTGSITVMALPDARDLQPRRTAPTILRTTSEGLGKPIPGGKNFGDDRAPAPSRPAAEPPRPSALGDTTAGSTSASGFYTAAQAMQGATVFQASCSSCHTKDQHTGPTFRAKWRGASIGPLYEVISSTMPLNAPGSLSSDDYAAVVAFMLRDSGYPSGNNRLPADAAALAKVTLPR